VIKLDLSGKVVIVTGASMGIGEATARELVRSGASVALAARSENRLAKLAADLNAGAAPGPRAITIPTDVSDPKAIERMVAQVLQMWGRVDVLVNNAGVGMYGALAEASIDKLRYLMEVNYWGAIMCAQAVVPHMKAQGGGTIVNVSSIVSKHVTPYQGAYCATKYALNVASDALRLELAQYGICVITVLPGVTFTEFQKNALQEGRKPPARVMAGGSQASQVGRAIVKAIRRGGPPDVYVTRFDQTYVTFATLFPRLTDKILMMVAKRRTRL
jgi:short-subunit dehydrogenase